MNSVSVSFAAGKIFKTGLFALPGPRGRAVGMGRIKPPRERPAITISRGVWNASVQFGSQSLSLMALVAYSASDRICQTADALDLDGHDVA